MKTWICTALLLLSTSVCFCGSGDELTNEDVIQLFKAGLGRELVIRKINSGDTMFDMSTKSLIKLKQSGVPDDVIELMLNLYTKKQKDLRGKISLEVQHLASDRPETRKAAMLYLTRLGKNAFPHMRASLESRNPELRAAVARTLGKLGDKGSAPLLLLLLTDKEKNVRYAAAEGLGLLKDENAISIARKNVTAGTGRIDGYLRLLGYSKDPKHASFISIRLLESSDPAVRSSAALALGEIGSSEGRQALEHAILNDRNTEVRANAALSLGRMAFPESLEVLKSSCRKDPDIRPASIEALGQYPAGLVVEFLLELLEQKVSPSEKIAIQASLRRLTHKDFGEDLESWKKWLDKNKENLPLKKQETKEQSAAPKTQHHTSAPELTIRDEDNNISAADANMIQPRHAEKHEFLTLNTANPVSRQEAVLAFLLRPDQGTAVLNPILETADHNATAALAKVQRDNKGELLACATTSNTTHADGYFTPARVEVDYQITATNDSGIPGIPTTVGRIDPDGGGSQRSLPYNDFTIVKRSAITVKLDQHTQAPEEILAANNNTAMPRRHNRFSTDGYDR